MTDAVIESPLPPNDTLQLPRAYGYIAYFALADLLIVPYFTGIVMPYGLPLVAVGLVTLRKKRLKPGWILGGLIVVALVVVSVATASTDRPSEVLREDILRAAQLLSSFLYFAYFYLVAPHLSTSALRRTLLLGMGWILGVGIVFVLFPDSLTWLRTNLYQAAAGLDLLAYHGRFTFIFADPNTAGYFYSIVVLFLMEHFRLSVGMQMLCLASLGFMAVVTQSVGVGAGLVGAGVVFVVRSIRRPSASALRRSAVVTGGAIALVGFLVTVLPSIAAESSIPIDSYVERITSDPEARRLEIYGDAARTVSPVLAGEGFTYILPNGSVARPHSDHIRLAYSYGVVVYVVVAVFLFRWLFTKGYLFLLPALVAFSVNSLIDEQKLLGLVLLLLALAHARRESSPPRRAARSKRGPGAELVP